MALNMINMEGIILSSWSKQKQTDSEPLNIKIQL